MFFPPPENVGKFHSLNIYITHIPSPFANLCGQVDRHISPPPFRFAQRGGGRPRFSIGLLLNKVRVGEALNKVSKRFMTLSNTTRPPRPTAIPRTFWRGVGVSGVGGKQY